MANIREIVLNILMEYDRDGTRKPSLLKDSLEKYDYFETRDKAFIKKVVSGCIERQIQIDYVLDSFSKTPVNKMQPFIRSLLRMSVYQILFMDQVPDSAACNEAVKLCTKHSFKGLSGFVNGVLRNISRSKDDLKYPDRGKDGGSGYLSVMYSMPEWICKMWTDTYGFDRTEEILKFFLEPRPTTIRLNVPALMRMRGYAEREAAGEGDSRNGTEDIYSDMIGEMASELSDCGVIVRRNPVIPYALDLEKTDNIRFLPGYEEGLFMVQDASSMLVTEIADPKPGQTLIDICAAPGGKCLHAAERMSAPGGKCLHSAERVAARGRNEDSGIVIARDVSERKCDIIRENAERLGITNIDINDDDALLHNPVFEEAADILYMDLPCSGLGIIGRKSDIKYNVSQKSLKEVAELQWQIIYASWDYVKPGGILMYSTCTVNRAENEDMVSRIISEYPFRPLDFSYTLPSKSHRDTVTLKSENGCLQLLPGQYGTDGFFIAKLKRI
ncbi:MAG: 16S rRNA (cytosine(967)-C(5))-methyltransferase [Butyrivibrio sp.]|nr:16S rRNA (cytosine(967)-C(5))-methyltransferase [Butyrivibrio sp.]